MKNTPEVAYASGVNDVGRRNFIFSYFLYTNYIAFRLETFFCCTCPAIIDG